jgi:hypothetical protein
LRLETNTDPDPDPIRIQGFNDQKFKKITAEKKNLIFFDQKLQFTYPLASIKCVKVTEEACSSQKRPSNTSKHEFCLLLWVIFALLDPDPDSEYGSGSGSTGPIEYGSNPDPDLDPKPCWILPFFLAYNRLSGSEVSHLLLYCSVTRYIDTGKCSI